MELILSNVVILIVLGLAIGLISGMVGIGGGILVIPLLMFFFGFSQARANGTSLAMLLPPIGIFAVLEYARADNLDWKVAALLATGFILGAWGGAKLVNGGWIHPTALRVVFAVFLLYVAGRMLFHPHGQARAALETTILMSGFMLVYAFMRLLNRRWKKPPNWSEVHQKRQRNRIEFDYEI